MGLNPAPGHDRQAAEVAPRPSVAPRGHALARNVKSSYGLALASGWVVYADGGARTRLSAIRPDGSGRIVLSRWLSAPIAARGRLVAP